MADCFLQESATSGDVSGCFNVTIIEEECTGPMTPIFFPLSLYYRKQIAAKFNLGDTLGKLSIEGIVGSMCMKNYISKHVVCDGNCFFRAIAFLITGSELFHNIICVNSVAYIVKEANWDHLKQYVPTKYSTGLEYVNNTRMAFFAEWATKVELFACAQFTGKDIIVYTAHGWLHYKVKQYRWETNEGVILPHQSKWVSFQSCHVCMRPKSAGQRGKE